MIIAIDGPAASGKGTLGKRLAAHYGLRHLDTGLIYRAVAKALVDAGAELTDAERAAAAAGTLDPARFDEQNFEDPGNRRGRVDCLGPAAGARRACRLPAGVRAGAAGRGP